MKLEVAVATSLGCLFAPAAQAADTSKTAEALKPAIACQSITDNPARLSCYDRAVQELVDKAASGGVLIVNREQVRQARRSAFGLTLPKLPFFDNAISKDEEPRELTASIRSARSLGNGRWELNLDAAGLWHTTEALSSAKTPKPGQEIKITKAVLGSYFIRMADGRSVKGLRVR